MRHHVQAILGLQDVDAIAPEYGNNTRGQAQNHRGTATAFDSPGFVPTYIRSMFCRGRGPFRWTALSDNPADIHHTNETIRELSPKHESLMYWVSLAWEQVSFQGLPSRVCRLGYATDDEGLTEYVRFALEISDLVASNEVSTSVVAAHDHLDAGSIASPYCETEVIRDDIDAVAD